MERHSGAFQARQCGNESLIIMHDDLDPDSCGFVGKRPVS